MQAAYLILDEATAAREFGSLERIEDNYPKYVVSMDETIGKTEIKGIRQMNIRDFLLADLDRGRNAKIIDGHCINSKFV